jgi:hypothetical protein
MAEGESEESLPDTSSIRGFQFQCCRRLRTNAQQAQCEQVPQRRWNAAEIKCLPLFGND